MEYDHWVLYRKAFIYKYSKYKFCLILIINILQH